MSQAWGHGTLLPAIWESESGGLQVQGLPVATEKVQSKPRTLRETLTQIISKKRAGVIVPVFY